MSVLFASFVPIVISLFCHHQFVYTVYYVVIVNLIIIIITFLTY
ncbi:MAG: hypothetical protein RMK94_17005 [Armatimonadota bacterium]|nr:hypothetical protein [Armatimonadota bacterium]